MASSARSWFRSLTFRSVLTAIGALIFVYTIYVISEPGEFTEWSEWSNCSTTCGGGVSYRTRTCSNPPPGLIGIDCDGKKSESKACKTDPCPQNGGYTEWTKFSECTKSCGSGERTRQRFCTNPVPLYGGLKCDVLGPSKESLVCSTNPCPINGGYTDWGKFSDCELPSGIACGKGKKVRTRSCSKPPPHYGGKPCEGPDRETAECDIPCPATKPSPTDTITSNSTTTTAKP